jgi:hypothetical protein
MRAFDRMAAAAMLIACAGCYRVHLPGLKTRAAKRATDAGSLPATKTTDAGSSPAVKTVEAGCSRLEQVKLMPPSQVDLLFVVDNSDSMTEEQGALRSAFPRLMNALTSGDRDGDGVQDFPKVKDMHIGVVSTDMGLPGITGIANCSGLGQDGILRNQASSDQQDCSASYPHFLEFVADRDAPQAIAADFACIATLGTGGCGFEQPLEAALKALWPAHDPMPVPGTGKNRVIFLADPITGIGALGHGDAENGGFLRNDPVSLLGVVVLTDEDDCSASSTHVFTPPAFLDPNDPLVKQSMNLRCHFNQKALYPVERYVNGLHALRAGNEDLVVFAAITGVPPDLVDAEALRKVDFANATQRDAFYQRLLGDSRMREVVIDHGTVDPSDDTLAHSCMSSGGTADPPIRIVQAVKGFGAGGIVQSICQADFTPALELIVEKLGSRLATRCAAP